MITFLNWKSFLIGLLSSVILLMGVYMYIQGEEYRKISNRPALTTKERVGILPNGKLVERYIIPYKGRFHYIYVTEDSSTTVKRTVNGRTTNTEVETFLK